MKDSVWILAADRLPEPVCEGVSEDVLVYFDEVGYDVANWDSEAKHWTLPNSGFSHPDADPTHWMPIPDIPTHACSREAVQSTAAAARK